MGTHSKRRPVSVTVIGWVFIVFAVLGILSGGMTITLFTVMRQIEELHFPSTPDEMLGPFADEEPWPYKMGSVVFQYYEILMVLQLLLSVFVLIVAVQFLKLRAWARTALEIVAWLNLAYTIGFGIFGVVSWLSMTSLTPGVPGGEGSVPPIFEIAGAVIGTAVMAFWAVPLVIIIKFLRGRTIREAVTQTKN